MCLITVWRNAFFMVESVSTSMLPFHPRWQWLFAHMEVSCFEHALVSCFNDVRIIGFVIATCTCDIYVLLAWVCVEFVLTAQVFVQTLYLGAYGAASVKPLKVWANTALVGHLGVTMAEARDRLPEELVACIYIYIYMLYVCGAHVCATCIRATFAHTHTHTHTHTHIHTRTHTYTHTHKHTNIQTYIM